jgi:hypothetical protein
VDEAFDNLRQKVNFVGTKYQVISAFIVSTIIEVTGQPNYFPPYVTPTKNIVALAQEPTILADALEDELNFTDQIVLSHLRDPKINHHPGCWAIQVALGIHPNQEG